MYTILVRRVLKSFALVFVTSFCSAVPSSDETSLIYTEIFMNALHPAFML